MSNKTIRMAIKDSIYRHCYDFSILQVIVK